MQTWLELNLAILLFCTDRASIFRIADRSFTQTKQSKPLQCITSQWVRRKNPYNYYWIDELYSCRPAQYILFTLFIYLPFFYLIIYQPWFYFSCVSMSVLRASTWWWIKLFFKNQSLTYNKRSETVRKPPCLYLSKLPSRSEREHWFRTR